MSLDSVVEHMHRQLLDHGYHDAAVVQQLLVEHDPLLDDGTVTDLIHRVNSRVSGLGVLDQFLADPTIDEVMVNGAGDLWIERAGRLECTGIIV